MLGSVEAQAKRDRKIVVSLQQQGGEFCGNQFSFIECGASFQVNPCPCHCISGIWLIQKNCNDTAWEKTSIIPTFKMLIVCAETHASLLSSLPPWFWEWLIIYIDKPSQGCLQAWFIYVTFLLQAWFKSATSTSILIQKWYFFFQLDSKVTLLLQVWFCQFFLC